MIVLAVVALVAGACGDDGDKKVDAADTTTTSTTSEVTTTTTALPLPSTTTKPAPSKLKKCVTAKSSGNDEATNQPLSIEVCIDDSTPSPTQYLTLTVTADDPDAPIGEGDCDIYVDWEGKAGNLCRDALIPPGPNDPPRTPEHGHRVKSFNHVYTDAGEYTVSVTVWSGPGDGHPDPYDNYATTELKLSVK
jgi:hypothetical protein